MCAPPTNDVRVRACSWAWGGGNAKGKIDEIVEEGKAEVTSNKVQIPSARHLQAMTFVPRAIPSPAMHGKEILPSRFPATRSVDYRSVRKELLLMVFWQNPVVKLAHERKATPTSKRLVKMTNQTGLAHTRVAGDQDKLRLTGVGHSVKI